MPVSPETSGTSSGDQEVAGARHPCREQGVPEEVLGGLLGLCGRFPGCRGEAQEGRVAGQIPSGLLSARFALRECLSFVASVTCQLLS